MAMVSNLTYGQRVTNEVMLIHRQRLTFEVEMTLRSRFGTLVWNAVIDVTKGDIDGREVWASAATVGQYAEVSTATARKYLEEIVSQGHVEKRSFMGINGYRVAKGEDPRE